MRKAGFPYDPAHGGHGWPKPIPYFLTDNSVTAYTAQILQQDLARIGLSIELRLVSWPALLAITSRPGAVAMSPQGWGLDYLDPSNFFDPLFSTSALAAESSTNKAFYSNRTYDALVDRAHRELDPALRDGLYRQANEILCDEAPWAFAYGTHRFDVHQPYVRDYKPHPVWQVDVSRVWLDRATTPLERRLSMWRVR
jgi:ABC-type transport system substrate-binding protein